MSAAPVPFRDQVLSIDVGAEQVLAANRSLRTRLLETVQALPDEQWSSPSRCTGWTVQDVVRHVIQVGDLIAAAVAAARAGLPFTALRGFDARTTPPLLLEAAGPEPVAQTRSDLAESTRRLVLLVEDLLDTGADLSVTTPGGRLPAHLAALHPLFDAAIHERDIAGPLRLAVPAGPEEMAAIASYQVLLTGRILCLSGRPTQLTLALGGGPTLELSVDGPQVGVRRSSPDEAPGRAERDAGMQCSGPATAVLDAMAGRGELADVLTGPSEAVSALSALRQVL